ncbi:MAG: TonB-dependent receptor domain-containing protein [Dysgonomonas sp.]
MNLVVKEDYKRNLFGNVKAGYGSDDKYSNKLMANYMNEQTQASLIGNMDNAGGGDDFMMGYFSPYSGIDENKSIGANFNINKSSKFKMGGNVRYSDNSNLLETKSSTTSFNPSYLNEQNSSTKNDRNNLSLGMNIEWRPDSLTTIYARTSASFSDSKDKTKSDFQKLSFSSQNDTTQGWTERYTKNNGNALNASLTVGRRLSENGRTLTLSLNATSRNEDGDGRNNSVTKYPTGNDAVIDQVLNNDNKTWNWGTTVSYVEPITSKNSIMLSYSIRQNKMDRDRKTFKKGLSGEYDIIDRDYTRRTKNFYISQNINLSFQSLLGKYEYTIGLNVDPSYSRSKVAMQDSVIEDIKQHVVNYSPSVRFSYKPNDNTSLNIDYSGATSFPQLNQISADTVILNSTSKYYGNPDLKPSYSNNLNIYYQKSDYESGRFLMISGGLNYTFNQIVNYAKIDTTSANKWNEETTYRNVDGNWSANLGISYNTPFRNKKFTFDTNTYGYYYRNIGFSNGEKNITNNLSINESVSLRFKTEKIENRLQLGYGLSITNNNNDIQGDMNVSNFSASNSTSLQLPYDFSIQNDISFTYNSGYSSDFKKTEVLWNASVSKSFLKKKAGLLKVQFYDILKDRTNVTRKVLGNEMSDMRTNTVSRYFLLSFTYRFNFANK